MFRDCDRQCIGYEGLISTAGQGSLALGRWERHAAALKYIFCHDQSVRARRAAFVAWIWLLKSAQAADITGTLTEVTVAQCLLERCMDRCAAPWMRAHGTAP